MGLLFVAEIRNTYRLLLVKPEISFVHGTLLLEVDSI